MAGEWGEDDWDDLARDEGGIEAGDVANAKARSFLTSTQAFQNFLFSGTGGLFNWYVESHGPIGVTSQDVRGYFRQEAANLAPVGIPDEIYWVDMLGNRHRPSVIGEEVAFGFSDALFKSKTLKDEDRATATEEKISTDALFRRFKSDYPNLWNQWVEMTFEWVVPDASKPAEGFYRQTGLKRWATTYEQRDAFYKGLGMRDFLNARYGRPGQNVKVGIKDLWLEWWLQMANVLWDGEKRANTLRAAGDEDQAKQALKDARLAVYRRCRRFSRNDIVGWIEASKFWELWRLYAGNRPVENKARAFQEGMKGYWAGDVIAESQFQPSVDAIEFEKWVRKFRLAHDPEYWAGMTWKEATEKMNYTGLVVASRWSWVRWTCYAHAFSGGYSPDVTDPVTNTLVDEPAPGGSNPITQFQTGPMWGIAREIYTEPRTPEEAARGEWVEGRKPTEVPSLGLRARDQLIWENWGRSRFFVWVSKWVDSTAEHELLEESRVGRKLSPTHSDVEKTWGAGAWKYQQHNQLLVTVLIPRTTRYEVLLLDQDRWVETVEGNAVLVEALGQRALREMRPSRPRLGESNLDILRVDGSIRELLAALRRICEPENVSVIHGYSGKKSGLAYAMIQADAVHRFMCGMVTEVADMRAYKVPGDALLAYYGAFGPSPCNHPYNPKGCGVYGNELLCDGWKVAEGEMEIEVGNRKVLVPAWVSALDDGRKRPLYFFGKGYKVMPPVVAHMYVRLKRIARLFHIAYRSTYVDKLKRGLRKRDLGTKKVTVGSEDTDREDMISLVAEGSPVDMIVRDVHDGASILGKSVSGTTQWPTGEQRKNVRRTDDKLEDTWAQHFWDQMNPFFLEAINAMFEEDGVEFDEMTFINLVQWATFEVDAEQTSMGGLPW